MIDMVDVCADLRQVGAHRSARKGEGLMVKVIRIFVVMTLLLVGFATPAEAARDVPFKGTVLGEHGPPDFDAPGCPDWAAWRYSSEGEGRITHMGRVQYALTQCTVPVADGYQSEGTITFTARNGDELWIEHTMLSQGIGDPTGPPQGFTFEGDWTAVGGTGRFINATGAGTLDGFGDMADGVAIGDFEDGLMEINFKGRIVRQVPIKASVLGEHGPPDYSAPDCPDWALWRFSSEGEGLITRLGRVTYTLTQCTVPGPDGITSEGTITLVARNGDELWLEHTMLSELIGEPDSLEGFTFEGEWTAVGGTGRFTNAAGSGTLDGLGDIEDGVAIGDIEDGLMQTNFEGTITRPRWCR